MIIQIENMHGPWYPPHYYRITDKVEYRNGYTRTWKDITAFHSIEQAERHLLPQIKATLNKQIPHLFHL